MNARQTYKALLKKKGYQDAQLEPMSTEAMEAILAGKSAAPAAAPGAGSSGATRFKPAARTRLLFPALAQSLASDAAGRQALLEVFEAGMKGYEEGAAEDEFVNDLAGAMAYFVGVGYFVIHDGEVPDEKGLDEVGFAKSAALIKDAANEGLKGFLGLDPSSIRITREGMEIVR
jgi:hypothetical protein